MSHNATPELPSLLELTDKKTLSMSKYEVLAFDAAQFIYEVFPCPEGNIK